MNSAISVKNLKKEFSISKCGKGRLEKLRHYLKPQYETLRAVDDVSFEIQRGEKIAFIGPNGAGKSTTIKLLTGIFQPTAGWVKILGMDPFKERQMAAYKIGTVFGQRSQLWYHLPAYDSFKLLSIIYNIDKKNFQKRLDYLCEIFCLHTFMARPIKELSLGERMRCELVASLLHNPEILFLDEPTIGLDIISKGAIRELIHQRSMLDSTTIFLTSHDIADIEKVCDRIILINKGKIIVDDTVQSIKKRFLHYKRISVKSSDFFVLKPHSAFRVIQETQHAQHFEVDLKQMNPQEAIHYIAAHGRFTDITIENPPLEDIIKGIYQA